MKNIMILISGRGGICSRDERPGGHRRSFGYPHIKTVRSVIDNLINKAYLILFFYSCLQIDVELGPMQFSTGSH